MALIKCPECGKEVSDKANACIHCGYPLISPIDDPDHPLNPYNLEIKAALRKFLRATSPERRHRDWLFPCDEDQLDGLDAIRMRFKRKAIAEQSKEKKEFNR